MATVDSALLEILDDNKNPTICSFPGVPYTEDKRLLLHFFFPDIFVLDSILINSNSTILSDNILGLAYCCLLLHVLSLRNDLLPGSNYYNHLIKIKKQEVEVIPAAHHVLFRFIQNTEYYDKHNAFSLRYVYGFRKT